MKKLLHERLREYEKNTDFFKEYSGKGSSFVDTLHGLADEIERYYIPRPRFEDGEPVQFGDETETLEHIDEILFSKRGVFELHKTNKSGYGVNVSIYGKDELVKRPQPKILDADGVEIKVGDTVWMNGISENKAHVETIHEDGKITVRFFDGAVWNRHLPTEYTHKEPDSLEKLRDEIAAQYAQGNQIPRSVWGSWADRISALIERGA